MRISVFGNRAFEQAKLYLGLFAPPLRRMNTKLETRFCSVNSTTRRPPMADKAMLLTMPPVVVSCLRPTCYPGHMLLLPDVYPAATPLP